jgi:hypothetical protein
MTQVLVCWSVYTWWISIASTWKWQLPNLWSRRDRQFVPDRNPLVPVRTLYLRIRPPPHINQSWALSLSGIILCPVANLPIAVGAMQTDAGKRNCPRYFVIVMKYVLCMTPRFWVTRVAGLCLIEMCNRADQVRLLEAWGSLKSLVNE